MTDTLGRMHSDAQFAGSSSVPAHVEMMGFLGMGNNPMVGATVAVAVAVQQAMKQSNRLIINSFYGDDSFESSPFFVMGSCLEVVNGVRFGVVLGLYPVETAVYIQKVFGCPIRLLNSLIFAILPPYYDRIATTF